MEIGGHSGFKISQAAKAAWGFKSPPRAPKNQIFSAAQLEVAFRLRLMPCLICAHLAFFEQSLLVLALVLALRLYGSCEYALDGDKLADVYRCDRDGALCGYYHTQMDLCGAMPSLNLFNGLHIRTASYVEGRASLEEDSPDNYVATTEWGLRPEKLNSAQETGPPTAQERNAEWLIWSSHHGFCRPRSTAWPRRW